MEVSLKPGTMKTTWIVNEKTWQMSLTNKKITERCWECGKDITSWYIEENPLIPKDLKSIFGTKPRPVTHLACAESVISYDNIPRANAYKKLKEANKEIFALEML